jgi:hypothetical protein
LIFTYYKKKVKLLAEFQTGAGGYLTYKNGVLGMYSRVAGENWMTLHKLNNGKLKKKTAFEYYQPYHYNNEKNTVIFKDGKRCSKKTYQKYLNKYFSEKVKITYKKYKK